MKLFGAIILISSGYFFGRMRRIRELKRYSAISLIELLLLEMREFFRSELGSAMDFFEYAWADGRFEKLSFIKEILLGIDNDEELQLVIHRELMVFAKDRIRENELNLLMNALLGIEYASKTAIIENIELSLKRLGIVKEDVERKNNSHRNYYETIYCLVGALAAILLI